LKQIQEAFMTFFRGGIYVPPNTYTQTRLDTPISGNLGGLKIPVYIGTGNEVLFQNAIELVRGSAADVDQQIVEEDETGRAVVAILDSGEVTLGDFDGTRTRFQVRNFPIVDGSGRGAVTNSTESITVIVNGIPVTAVGVDGEQGIVELAQAPPVGAEVTCSYFFNRTDTQTTDNLSDQVTAEAAILLGVVGEPFSITAGINDEFIVSADGSDPVTITIPEGTWTATQIAVFINTYSPNSLLANTYSSNQGFVSIRLTANQSISIGEGSANGTLGFTGGASTSRNASFFTFQRPIVDGSNGGITTTDPSDVTVLVNGVEVTPLAVDGSAGRIDLPFPPASGSTVEVTYFFNSWQDTFDYLPNTGVLNISRCGVAPNRNDFIEGVDFILKDDRILWGTASLVSAGETVPGSTEFGENQITTTLIDNKAFLEECSPVVDANAVPPVDTRKTFQLPFQPTTGNGRNSPLGQDLFNQVSNGRIDLPTNRPDLISAYWGFSVPDALARGPVTINYVDSTNSTIELAEAVPAGAQVFATFYYNTIQDSRYTLSVVTPGPSGVGTYRVADRTGNSQRGVRFGSKSAGLTGISIQFPSGSELLPDSRYEGGAGSDFKGSVDETVTVTFADRDETPAKYTVAGPGPYLPVTNASDHARVQLDGADPAGVGAAGIDLSNPTGIAGVSGFFGSLMGSEVVYAEDTGGTTFTVTSANNTLNVSSDGVLIESSVTPAAGLTVGDFVSALNTAAFANAPRYVTAGRFNGSVVIDSDQYNRIAFVYTGDVNGSSGVLTANIPNGTYNAASSLASAVEAAMATEIAGLGAGFAGLAISVTADSSSRLIFSLTKATADAQGYLEFVQPVATPASESFLVVGSAAGDEITIAGVTFTGNAGPRTSGANNFDASIIGGPALALEIVDAINDPLNGTAGIVTAAAFGPNVVVTSVATGSAANDLEIAVTLEATPQSYIISGASYVAGVEASSTLTINLGPATAGDVIVVAGIPLTGVAGARTPGADDFDATQATPALLSAEIEAAINDAANSWNGVASALDLTGSVQVVLAAPGTGGNAQELGVSVEGAFGTYSVAGSTSTIGVAATGTISVLAATGGAGDIITLAGLPLTGVGGPRTPGADDFDATLGSTAALSAELTSAINDGLNSFAAVMTATDLTGSVQVDLNTPGTDGDLLTLVITFENFIGTYSAVGFAGGQDSVKSFDVIGLGSAGDILTIEGTALTGNAGPRTPGADNFDATTATTVTDLATEIVAAINDPLNSFAAFVSASNVGGRITLTANSDGAAGTEVNVVITTEATLGTYLIPGENFIGGIDGIRSFNTLGLASVGDILTIAGVALTGVSGTRTSGSNDFSVDATTEEALAVEIAAAINDGANGFSGLVSAVAAGNAITLTADPSGAAGSVITIVITNESVAGTFGIPGIHLSGGGGAANADFSIIAGIDTAVAAGGTQTKLGDVEIARRYTVAGTSGALNHDRIILRNRLLPGSGSILPYHQVEQGKISIQGSSSAVLLGLETAEEVSAGYQATIQRPSIVGHISFAEGQATGFGDDRDGQPVVIFRSEGGVQPQNNVLRFTVDTTTVVTEFTDAAGAPIVSGASASVPLGPVSIPNTILWQIANSMADAGLGASPAAVAAEGLIAQEGDGIRLTSPSVTQAAYIEIGVGSAEARLGFSSGQSDIRDLVSAEAFASALMAHSHTTIGDHMFLYGTPTAGYFAAAGLATKERDELNNEFLFIQSQTLGTSSSVVWQNATTDDVLAIGTGLAVLAGEGDLGEDSISGFFVTSSDSSDGSGTANNSRLNNGVGQDGVVGQTYRDEVTGLAFSILPREGGQNYPTGSSFTMVSNSIISTDANLPILAIPGVEMIVSNTTGTVVDNTAIVETFDKGGSEPAVGDIYYVSYSYTKSDFDTRLFTRLSAVQDEYGEVSPDNPVSLAAYLAFLNGAVLIGISQVQKEEGSSVASEASYLQALEDLTAPLPGGRNPDIIVPLIGNSLSFFQSLCQQLDILSSPRFQAERTAIVGLTSGSAPEIAKNWARDLDASRMRLVYPDIVRLSLTDPLNNTTQFLVDGFYLAAALSGFVVTPSADVATPWTRKTLSGFDELARKLTNVEKNDIAQSGVTIIEENLPTIRVRQGFTTNMENVLTRTPTVIQISDEIQQRARAILGKYIGVKFVQGITGQIEGDLSSMLRRAKADEIITAYRGVEAIPSPVDPTAIEAQAFYSPVFPLLYIFVTFNLRSTI
jgi:hypothetical protein